ncbi:unnamed protein product [Lampetra planeri]
MMVLVVEEIMVLVVDVVVMEVVVILVEVVMLLEVVMLVEVEKVVEQVVMLLVMEVVSMLIGPLSTIEDPFRLLTLTSSWFVVFGALVYPLDLRPPPTPYMLTIPPL